jgi:hypothetical protein
MSFLECKNRLGAMKKNLPTPLYPIYGYAGGVIYTGSIVHEKNFTGFKACVVCLIRPLSELDLIYFVYFF